MGRSFAPAAAVLLSLAAAFAACAETSPSGVVVAPMASGSPSSAPAFAADGSTDGSDTDAIPPAPVTDADAGSAPARFRACMADADCVVVPRVGCCHNGWNEAVAASQRTAYAASFTCPNAHPLCPMFIVRDTRAARCDAASHLCTMVSTGPALP